MSICLFPFVMDAVATVARSWDFHREMFGCERLQKIPRVEDLRRRADSPSLEITVKDARGSFDNDRRRDRVNVAPSRNGAALLAVVQTKVKTVQSSRNLRTASFVFIDSSP